MSDRPALRIIQIESPCPLPINGQSQNARSQFCRHCQREVHNLSAMRDDELDRLLCRGAAGCACNLSRRPRVAFVRWIIPARASLSGGT